MKHGRWLAALLGVLLWGAASRADITNTTPYDYDQPPAPGKEQGTYMAAATGSFGPDCFFTAIGTAKYLPNPDGSGGKHCTKINVELSGSGPGCAFKPFETMPVVITADYTYNGDGTLCERAKLVGGPLDGTEFPFHTYVDANGRWVFPTTQDIAYPCPGAASNLTGLASCPESRRPTCDRRRRPGWPWSGCPSPPRGVPDRVARSPGRQPPSHRSWSARGQRRSFAPRHTASASRSRRAMTPTSRSECRAMPAA